MPKLTPLQLEIRRTLAAKWERQFEFHWQRLEGPKPRLVRQAKIIPDRQFAFDFVFPDALVAVDLDGGTFGNRSGHNSGAGIERGYEKCNLAAAIGWCVLRFGTKRMARMDLVVREVLDVVRARSGVLTQGATT